MPSDQQQALTLIKLINNWARINISLDPYEFNVDFAIVLDTNNGLIFSFIWNLQD